MPDHIVPSGEIRLQCERFYIQEIILAISSSKNQSERSHTAAKDVLKVTACLNLTLFGLEVIDHKITIPFGWSVRGPVVCDREVLPQLHSLK